MQRDKLFPKPNGLKIMQGMNPGWCHRNPEKINQRRERELGTQAVISIGRIRGVMSTPDCPVRRDDGRCSPPKKGCLFPRFFDGNSERLEAEDQAGFVPSNGALPFT